MPFLPSTTLDKQQQHLNIPISLKCSNSFRNETCEKSGHRIFRAFVWINIFWKNLVFLDVGCLQFDSNSESSLYVKNGSFVMPIQMYNMGSFHCVTGAWEVWRAKSILRIWIEFHFLVATSLIFCWVKIYSWLGAQSAVQISVIIVDELHVIKLHL